MNQTNLSENYSVDAPESIMKPLITIFGIIFLEFLIMGISLGVIPQFVHQQLGFSNFIVGIVIGSQYAATLLTRHSAGKMADSKGGKKSVTLGIILSSISGILCLVSTWLASYQTVSLVILIMGRILLGFGESFLVIGIFAWGFILVGNKNAGKVMVWNGMGMYGGMACGAPLGIMLTSYFTLSTAFSAIIILPIISYFTMLLLSNVSFPKRTEGLPFHKAVALVWRSGSGLALASIGFGGIASFVTLYFYKGPGKVHRWQSVLSG
jgi:MFS family permease